MYEPLDALESLEIIRSSKNTLPASETITNVTLNRYRSQYLARAFKYSSLFQVYLHMPLTVVKQHFIFAYYAAELEEMIVTTA